MSKIIKGRWEDLAYREKMSKIIKERWKNADYAKNWLDKMKAINAIPEKRELHSIVQKEAQNKPNVKKRKSECLKER